MTQIEARHPIGFAAWSDAVAFADVLPFTFEDLDSESVGALTTEQLDELPFGVIAVDPRGRVVVYNAVEAQLAKRTPDQVIGKNFWKDVARCTNRPEFRGRVDALLEQESGTDEFTYAFAFPWGTRHVRIRASRAGERRWLFLETIADPTRTAR